MGKTIDRRLDDLEAAAKPKGEPKLYTFWQSIDDDNLYRGNVAGGEEKTFTREELDRMERENPDDMFLVVQYVKNWRGYSQAE